MEINEHELLDLLMDDIYALQCFDERKSPEYKDCIWLEYYNEDGWYEEVVLRHEWNQIYTIVEASNEQEFSLGETVSVDEILDIVL